MILQNRGKVKSFLVISGQRSVIRKMQKVLIELFQKFAEHEAEPRTNARASALATALQNREALLLDFGQSQYFPNVGKYCALSPRALRRARTICLRRDISYGYDISLRDAICSALRNVKEKIRRGGFSHLYYISLRISFRRQNFAPFNRDPTPAPAP